MVPPYEPIKPMFVMLATWGDATANPHLLHSGAKHPGDWYSLSTGYFRGQDSVAYVVGALLVCWDGPFWYIAPPVW